MLLPFDYAEEFLWTRQCTYSNCLKIKSTEFSLVLSVWQRSHDRELQKWQMDLLVWRSAECRPKRGQGGVIWQPSLLLRLMQRQRPSRVARGRVPANTGSRRGNMTTISPYLRLIQSQRPYTCDINHADSGNTFFISELINAVTIWLCRGISVDKTVHLF